MEDRGLEIDNLHVKISILRREERQWLAVLADDSQSANVHFKARVELHKIMAEILAASASIKKLEGEL